jgi:hypothetical protein
MPHRMQPGCDLTSPRSLGLSVVEDRLLPLAVVFGELRGRHAGKRAVTVTKGSTTLVLRDEQGIPLWKGQGMG